MQKVAQNNISMIIMNVIGITSHIKNYITISFGNFKTICQLLL